MMSSMCLVLRLLFQFHLFLLLSNYSIDAAVEHVRCIEKERHALLDLKAGLQVDEDADLLSSWNENSDCCQWERVSCSNQTGHVEMLDLNGADHVFHHFRGEIGTSLTELPHLQYLNLSWNSFKGIPFPEWFSSLTNLRVLDLHLSHFGGHISNSFANLMHLQYLDLSLNYLHGEIPYQLRNLSHLQYLDLSYNHLSGTIPHQLGSLPNLKELYLGHNKGLRFNDKHGGEWLSNLTLLTTLDLSNVLNLNRAHGWLQMIASLPRLDELKLSGCHLSDPFLLSVSHSNLKFSSSLAVVDLSYNSFSSSIIFHWIFNVIPNLTELDLSYNLLKGPIQYDFGKLRNPLQHLVLSGNKLHGGILKYLGDICTLHSLHLSNIMIKEDISTILLNLSGCARYSLQELSLLDNQITGTLPDLSIFPSLSTLDLSNNWLSGKVPEGNKLPSKLEYLKIESNSLEGGIPKSFGNICTLRSLYLSNNNLSEELPVMIHNLSAGCAKYSLQELKLASNQITGTIPDMSMFPSLEVLDLADNLLNGEIHESIRLPSQLVILQMRFNNLEGVISESHFANMSMLKFVDLSSNSLVLTFSENWVPPFQLDSLYLGACRLGPDFPKWLQTLKYLQELDISNAGISDAVPKWFWVQMKNLAIMNVSYNNLTGTIPNLPTRFFQDSQVILASNQFEGSIPSFLRGAALLQLSKNNFSEARALLCANTTNDRLGFLDLSKNHLSGHLQDCWSTFKSLEYVDLSDNTLSGEVPFSMGSLLHLKVLILRNNSLTGKLPVSLKNCKSMLMIDLGENRLSGPIPSWIGRTGQQLKMLSLRRNHFSGSLPQNLCNLKYLQLLDLSANNLSGKIFRCLQNFTAMSKKHFTTKTTGAYYTYSISFTFYRNFLGYDLIALLTWKGSEQLFKKNMLILNSIDLSSNQLTGDIPEGIGKLIELVSLNLSRNNLTGQITSEIGKLASLDFLDLSRNHFFGSIPPSLAQIDRLSVLNLSYNNLSGRIPIGTQLQSFDASSYEGNADLCGKPLDKKCPEDEQTPQETKPLDKSSPKEYPNYLSVELGFITGFWGLLGSLLLNRTWRHAYFLFLNNIIDTVYVVATVNTAKFQKMLRGFLEKFVWASPKG